MGAVVVQKIEAEIEEMVRTGTGAQIPVSYRVTLELLVRAGSITGVATELDKAFGTGPWAEQAQ